MNIIKSSTSLNDKERNDILFNGDVVIFNNIPAMLELNFHLRELIKGVFQGDIEFEKLDESNILEFHCNIDILQKKFRSNKLYKNLFALSLKQSGMRIEKNYSDIIFMRSVPPVHTTNNQYRGKIGYHRDTWGSNIQNQINWWSTIFPITDKNTLVLYPRYWSEAVENNTDHWSYKDFCNARITAKKNKSDINYPYSPSATQIINEENAVSITINPGDLLCFSSAHLHGSTSEPRDYCRFNIELRTFSDDDLCLNHPPPNIDNKKICLITVGSNV
ncbi:hypothetical protein [Neptunomonas japonica]|uniref:hypothetical protein n=1 Tax=Neptunomonas japonica TaxID=417574 RepID=UPI000400CA78|nr:hypothetical protein [Neptunomonas japonica]